MKSGLACAILALSDPDKEEQSLREMTGKVAVVTGGSSGIGQSIALQLANCGCKLAVVGTSQSRIDTTLAMMPSDTQCAGYVCDVSDRAAVASLADTIERDFGQVDIVINNAGITHSAPFSEFDMELFDRIVNVNFFGVVNCCHAFLPKLLSHGAGHIVNMSSMLGFIGVPSQSPYVSSKFAIRGFTESLWAELDNTRIAVTGIYPGTIQSDILRRASFSNNLEKEAMQKMMDRFGIPASKVALQTIDAIRHRRREIIIGKDARALILFKRFLPGLCHRITASGARKARKRILSGEWSSESDNRN